MSLQPITCLDDKKQIPSRIKKLNPLLAKPPFRWLISGASGTGKSTFLINILTKKGYYKGIFKPENIFIFSRTARLDDKIKKVKSANLFDTVDETLIEEIFQEQLDIKDRKGEKYMPYVLMVFDDMINTNIMKNNSILTKYIHICRHYKVSMIILTQKFNAVPRIVRINSDVITLFRPYSFNELDLVVEENSDKSHKKEFYKMITEIFKKPFNFLHIDYQAKDLNQRYREGFDKFLEIF